MPLRAVIYSSQVAEDCDAECVGRIAAASARFNQMAGVTGVLLFDGGRFLQYLEGPDDGVRAVYERIRSSDRHANLVELADGRVTKRLFPYWRMEWLPIEPEDVERMIDADWSLPSTSAEGVDSSPPGIAYLVGFVERTLPTPAEHS